MQLIVRPFRGQHFPSLIGPTEEPDAMHTNTAEHRTNTMGQDQAINREQTSISTHDHRQYLKNIERQE